MIFVVGNHQNGLLVLGRHGLQESQDFLTIFTVQIAGRLVRQNQCRSWNQRPAESDTLLLATGELTVKMMTAFGQSQNIQQLVDKPLVWPLVVKQQRKSDVLFYIQFRDQIK